MVTYAQLLNMDTSRLATASDTSADLSKTLSNRAGEVSTAAAIPPGMWSAADSEAAADLLTSQQPPLYDASDAFRRGEAALADLVDKLEVAKQRLGDAQDLVAGTGVTIGPDGSVTVSPEAGSGDSAVNESVARQAEQIIRAALRMAEEADDAASTALDDTGPQIDPKSIPDGDGETPQEISKWWKSLSEAERQTILRDHPELVGGLDGIPAESRHQANMELLRADARSGHDPGNAQQLLNRIEASQHGPENERIFLLGYEAPGADGNPDAKVIAAIGNPDTADHTAVFVPGTSADLGGVGGYLDDMGDLRGAAVDASGNQKVSTMVWLGYDAPDDLPNAVRSDIAQDGAGDLREFTRGLDANNADSHTTVIGHSYGSTVVGTADAMGSQGGDDGLATDDVIAVGSPGMGTESPDRQGIIDTPMVDDASDMHTADDHIWSGASASDPVSYLTIHGGNPADFSFGAERFSTDGAGGHSEYFNPGTDALRNQAHIVTGQYDEVEHVGRRPK